MTHRLTRYCTRRDDIITTAFEGYRLLSVSGQGEALKNARRELSRRFSRTRREQEETTAA